MYIDIFVYPFPIKNATNLQSIAPKTNTGPSTTPAT